MLPRWAERLVFYWEQLQVELHGQYSVERLHRVHEYSHKSSRLRIAAIILLTPVPCLVIISLMDLMPLESLRNGFQHSYVFRTRACMSAILMAFGALIQYRQLIPSLRTSSRQIMIMSLFTGIGTAFGALLLSRFTSYPIPFMAILVSPIYMALLTIAIFVAWGRQLKEDERLGKELQQYQIVVSILFTLTIIYPAYNYGYSTISPSWQTWFALLLPVIKLCAKNAISPFCKYIEDYKPEALIFNVEIFHALFVAICMQNTSSIRTTLLLMAMDFVHAVMSLRDIQIVVNRIVVLRTKITDASKSLQDKTASNGQLVSPDIGQVVDHVLFLVKSDAKLQEHGHIRVRSRAVVKVPSINSILNRKSFNAVVPAPVTRPQDPMQAKTPIEHNEPSLLPSQPSPISYASPDRSLDNGQRTGSKRLSGPQSMRLRRTSFGFDIGTIPDTVSIHEQHVLTTVLTPAERTEYVERTLQLLHMVEFMVLVEYTEVIIPIIYSLYLMIIVRLPNRKYYVQLQNLTTDNIMEAVGNITLYASLELLSFIVLDLFLRYKLQFSPMRQLAYVLEKQWKLVQIKLIVWILFMIQISLVHYGMDFSFNFNWAENEST